MDLQRHLSLDLEREPVLEDSAEEGYEFESAVDRENTRSPREHNRNSRALGGGISLDINATPDPSTPAESLSTGSRGQELEVASRWPAHIQQRLDPHSLLHVIFMCLVKHVGEDVLDEKHDCIEGRSFKISVSPDSSRVDWGTTLNDSTRLDENRKPLVVLLCEWSSEAQVLAERSLDVLARLKLKL